jgi:ribosomal-protein-serine acetyltransferase
MFSRPVDADIEIVFLEDEHAEELFLLVDRNRAYLRQWLPWLDSNTSVKDNGEFIRRSHERFAKKEGVTAGIWHKGALVGVISFVSLDMANRSGMIGYWIAAEHQGKGLVTRSCAALIDYGFEDLSLNRIVIRAATDNRPSLAVPQRLGFTREGVERQAEWVNDRFVDLVVFSLLRDEWHGGTRPREPRAS